MGEQAEGDITAPGSLGFDLASGLLSDCGIDFRRTDEKVEISQPL